MTELVRPLGHVLHGIEVLLRLGQFAAAGETIDAVARSQPNLAALHVLRGWLCLDREQPDRAVTAFRLATGRDPIDPLAWLGLSRSSEMLSEQTSAAERAQMLSPNGTQAQLWHDLHSGKPHLAITTLHAFSRRFPDRAEWTIWCAETLRRLGSEQQARELLEPLLRRRPRPAPALFVAAALTLDGVESHQHLLAGIAIDPLGSSAARIFAPDPPPFPIPAPPVVAIPASLAQTLDSYVPPPDPPAPVRSHPPQLAAKTAATGETSTPPTTQPDPETAAALQAVEQATRRLLGRAPLIPATDQTTALLITHRGALEASCGAAAATIITTIQEYGAALAQRGIHAECVLLDQADSLAPFQVAPIAERTAPACKQAIDGICARLKEQGRDVDAVVLIGGDGVIPFHRLPNPSQDADANVPSDNPYGCGAGSELAPELIVARFPDGGADGGTLLLEQLRRAIDYHQHWHVTGPQGGVLTLPFMRRFTKSLQAGGPVVSWGVSAAAWQLPSQTVYGELGSARQLMFCPPATPDVLEAAWPHDGRMLYFNLHGLAGGPNWYGQPVDGPADAPLPVAFRPDDIGTVAPAMICISEACYGAEIVGRTPADAIALRLLSSGALAFVGSTVTAYGAVTLPLGGADLLVQQTLQQLRRGYPLGRAMTMARDWMAREVVQQQGYLDPDDAKTLLSFVVLGDPWATPYTRPVLERKTALPQIRPVVVQRRPVAVNLIAPAAIHVAQQLIAKVAPSLSRAPLSAVGQGRPDRIAKGQASAVVFSATESLPTTDGRAVAQIARVTVAGGEARKLLLSR